jgi:hypothetical protein
MGAHRITGLTGHQRATIRPHAGRYIAAACDTGPVDWDAWEAGARGCYAAAGIPWPGHVIRVSSPFVGSLAAPIIALLLAVRRRGRIGTGGRSPLAALARIRADAWAGFANDTTVESAVLRLLNGAVDARVDPEVRREVGAAMLTVSAGVDNRLESATRSLAFDTRSAPELWALDHAVEAVLADVTRVVSRGAAADRVPHEWLRGEIRTHLAEVRQRHVGRTPVPFWRSGLACLTWFLDHGGITLRGELRQCLLDYEAATRTGWWSPHRDFVLVAERPREVRTEPFVDNGTVSRRPHAAGSAAVTYADGMSWYFWHGVRVPADLIEGGGWPIEWILREGNLEIRRCAIERIGWDRFAAGAGLNLVTSAPDPGNPGQVLELYDLPRHLIGGPGRLLLCSNGTVRPDGTRPRYGLTVPAAIGDPIAAAAWTYGLTRDEYARAERRS